MKKLALIAALTFGILGSVFASSKMTSHAAVVFDDFEEFEKECSEAEEVASEIAAGEEEAIILDDTDIEVFITVDPEPVIEEEPGQPVIEEEAEEETSEEEVTSEPKGLIPEESEGEVKADIVIPSDDDEIIKVKHDGVKPHDVNKTEAGQTAVCIEEQEQHPDYSGTDYVVVDNAADVNKYDHIVVGYTEAVNRGEDKTLCDRAVQAAIWDLNGSQDDQEMLLAASHDGQDKETVIRLYNEFKNHENVDHSKWKITYTTLAPTETSEFGDYQALLCFEAVENKEDKPVIPEKEVPVIPEEDVPVLFDDEVPETGDHQLPVAPFAAAGFITAIAIVGVACKRNAR